MPMLSTRQKQILRIIVDEYVKDAQPVGSKSICDMLNVSSATVRNDMAFLEKEGYIDKTHSSSGRIPLDKGYRLYVEDLLNESEGNFEKQAYELVDSVFTNGIIEREDAVKKACSLLSELTNYTSVVLGPDNSNSLVSKIELVSLHNRDFLLIVITNDGHIESKSVSFKEGEVNIDELNKVIEILNEVLINTPVKDVSYKLKYIMDNRLVQEFIAYRETIIANFIDAFMKFAETNYYVSGSSNMLVQPEFQDSKKMKRLLEVFEKRDLIKLIKNSSDNSLSIKIGKETGIDAMDDATVISVPYEANNGEKGSIALVGPTRMDYKRVIPLLEYIAKDISKLYNSKADKDGKGK